MKTLLARLLLIVSIALVPGVAFQAYTESEARRVRQQLLTDEALRILGEVSAEQQRIAEGAEQALDVLIGALALQDGIGQACPRLLTNVLAQSPRYTAAGVIGLNGHFLFGTSQFDLSLDVSDRAYFRDALHAGGFVIGEYAVGRVTGKRSVHTAKPFSTRDGTIAGVVNRGARSRLAAPAARASPPAARHRRGSAMDRNGTMLARFPDGARYVGHPMPQESRFSPAGDAIRVAPMIGIDGRPRLTAYAPVGAALQGVRISVGLDQEASLAGGATATGTELELIVAGAIWALVMTALLGALLIRRPFERLLAVADRWRSGDLAARTGLHADNGEFGRLAGAFDRMAVAHEARELALHTALESTTNSWPCSTAPGASPTSTGTPRR